MNDSCTYILQLRGQATESEFNAMSPLQMIVIPTEPGGLRVTFSTDQSGLVGLMRHLHGLGFVFLSFNRIENTRRDDHDQR